MFRKIVSNLAFSPSLVGQLSFYARRLRKEEFTRRLGLIFTALALVVQSLVVFSPPEAANASVPGKVGNAPRCDASVSGERGKAFRVNNQNQAVVDFTITGGKKCKVQISANSFWAPSANGRPYEQQILHQRNTKVFNGPGSHTMRVALPPKGGKDKGCYYQVDLTYGVTNFQPLIAYGHGELSGCGGTPIVVSCKSLDIVKIQGANRYRATAKAQVVGSKVTGFHFKVYGLDIDRTVKTSNEQASIEFSKSKPGTYSARASVSTSYANNVTSPNCSTQLTIPEPDKPYTECLSVTANITNGNQVNLTGTALAGKGGKIKRYVYYVKDSNGKTLRTLEKGTNSLSDTRPPFTEPVAGTYSVELLLHTSEGNRSGGDCTTQFTITPPPVEPVAVCSNVIANIQNRNRVSLTGSAQVQNATVSKYNFVVKDSSGKEIKSLSVESTDLEVTTETFDIAKPGDYSVTLTVETSIGPQTNEHCNAKFTIVKPDVCPYNPKLPPSHPDCQPCPGDEKLWIKDDNCHPQLVFSKTASNLTRGDTDATSRTAKASDKITFTLTVENHGLSPATVTIYEDLGDVLEYANIIDAGGGKLDATKKRLSWPTIKLAPKEKTTRVIAVQVLEKIPITNTGVVQKASYDCKIENTFGNKVNINIDCPVEKLVAEQLVQELPHTGPTENMIFAGVLLAVVVYFYARSRQLSTEVRLVRRDVHMGAI